MPGVPRNQALLAQGLESLCRFFLWEGRLQDGQKACRIAVDGVLNSVSEQQTDGSLHLAFWSLLLAWESKFVGKMASKEALLDKSQGILDRLASGGHDIRAEQAFVFLSKADAVLDSKLDDAIYFASLGLPLFRELGSSWGEARTLQTLGRGHVFRGEYEAADKHFHQSLEIMRLLDDKLGTAKTIQYLGIVARQQGAFSEAEGLHRQSLEIMRQLQSRFHEKVCLTALSYTLSWSGKFVAARETARQVMKLDQDLGQHPDSRRLNVEALAASHLGYYSEVRIMATEALELARKEDLSGQIGWALMSLGVIAFAERDLVKARHYLQESIKALSQLQNILLALPLAAVSYVIRAQGDVSSARKRMASVLRAGTDHHAISPIIYCLPLVALFAADDGDHRRAIELYGLAQQYGYISNSCWFADVACNELDEVRASIPKDVAAAAEARGREMDVWETAEALLRELDGR